MKKRIGAFFIRFFYWRRIFRSFRGIGFKSVMNLALSALVDVLASAAVLSNPRMLFNGMYRVEGLNVVVYTRGGTEDLYHLLPGREGPVEHFIRSALQPGDVFVDVGANVGYYTILGALRGANVIAVEPVPQTVLVLKANLRLNNISNVVVIDKCAWSESGRVEIRIPLGSYYGLASAYRKDKGVSIKVECIKLDDVLRDFSSIRLVKLDVEGAEYDVLKGMESTLDKTDFIVIEVSHKAKDVFSLLKFHGFKIKKLDFENYFLAQRSTKNL